MKTEAALAIAAVAVAVLAMVISFSQVSQQLASSGHQYRLCDSVVYGGKTGLPGQGRRIWSWTQLRFRVIYEVPTFGFAQENETILPNTSPSAFRSRVMNVMANEKNLSNLGTQHQVGEASWVSFCRKVKEPCHDRLLISLTQGDADRCPGDLPNIPVPVSFKDVLVMAFAAGLDCTEASFTRKTISMQGKAGSITSSHHPVLGPLIHFIPQRNEVAAEVPRYWTQWVARLQGLVPIANELLSSHGHRGLAYFEQRDNLATILRLHMQENPQKPADSRAIKTAKSNFSFLDPRSSSAALDMTIDDIKKDQDDSTLFEKMVSTSGVDEDLAPDVKPLRQLSTLAQSDHPSSTFWRRYWSASHTEVRWMWMSQMNVISGCWATPWKFNFQESICRCAIRVVRIEMISTYTVDVPLMTRLSANDFNHLFRHGIPLQSHPPYAVHAARDQRVNSTYSDEIAWVYFPPFDCKLPAVYIHFAFLDRLQGYNYTDSEEEDNTFYTKELMRFDYWMWRASETRAIIDGKLDLIKNTPAIVEYLIGFFMGHFEETYVFELDPKSCREAIKKVMIDMGASEAERMFLFVAMLRTLRFAVCVCQGLDTSQALEILKKDIRAHMV